MKKLHFTKEMRDFVKQTWSRPEFIGCCYYYFKNSDYALVFAYNDDHELNCKLAYNCDDLQCSYDYDWSMPEYEGEVLDFEIMCCKEYEEFALEICIKEDLVDAFNLLFKNN